MDKLHDAKKTERGFTIIEMVVVTAILGFVMMATYSLYLTHQRTAYTQDEVVEVQQNLRIGMDSMVRDIRLAGLLRKIDTSLGSNPTVTGVTESTDNTGPNNSDTITLSYADASGIISVITTSLEGLGTFNVDSKDAVDALTSTGTVTVQIVRPMDRSKPGGDDNYFQVTGHDRNAQTVTLAPVTGSVDTGPTYKPGDMILKITYASVVTYGLGTNSTTCKAPQLCLMKTTSAGAVTSDPDVIAQNMAGLQFHYLMSSAYCTANGFPNGFCEIDSPTDLELKQIRAVRIELTGQTISTTGLSGNQPKERQLETVVRMRNALL